MAPVFHYECHVRAVTVPGPETDLALYVGFDRQRFLFGCGEGTQRAFTQRKLSLRGLSAVFIGEGGSRGRSGLPGLTMSALDAGSNKLDIVGPSDITRYLATSRASVYRKNCSVITHPHPEEYGSDRAKEIYSTDCLNVRSVALRPEYGTSTSGTPAEASSSRLHPRDDMVQEQKRAVAAVGHMFQGEDYTGKPDHSKRLTCPSREETATQMVYICKTPPVPGKFNVSKSTALQVPRGPLRARLVQGEAIEFDDPDNPGTTKVVKPEDVVDPGREGATFLVVDCSLETLPILLKSPVFQEFHPDEHGAGTATEVAMVIHRVPTAVWQDSAYLNWIKAFGPNTQHTIADVEYTRRDPPFLASAWNTLRLSLLDSDIFHLPSAVSSPPPDTTTLPPNVTMLIPTHIKKLQPSGPLEEVRPNPDDIHPPLPPYPSTLDGAIDARRKLLKTVPEFAVECAKARAAVRADKRWASKPTFAGSEITVTTLGTGSAIPSKYRNVSCTHLDIPNVGGVLLDCGEGSLGQLRRRFGDGTNKLLEDLRLVFISHMHADHHLGLQSILEERFKLGVTSKLYLLAPAPIAVSLSEAGAWSANTTSEALENFIWIDNTTLEKGYLPKFSSIETESYESGSSDGTPDAEDRTGHEGVPQAGVPRAADHLNGSRRWPSRDILGTTPYYAEQYAKNMARMLKEDLGLDGLRVPTVNHRGRAWGLVIQHKVGWKVVYSGDTTPSRNLIWAGRNATLLIHEATLDDDKTEDAKEKGHSTFSQAIEVGRQMNVSHTLLNHFSQRYPKAPKSRQQEDAAGVVCISFDYMSVKVGDMWRMKYYIDALEKLFDWEKDDEEDVIEQAGVRAPKKKQGVQQGKKGNEKKAKPEKGKAKRSPSPSLTSVQAKKYKSESSENSAPA